MRDATPIVRFCEISEARHLRFREDIPEAEFDPQAAIRLQTDTAVHQGLRINDSPIGIARLDLQRFGFLQESAFIYRLKQSRTFQIAGNYRRDISADLLILSSFTKEIRNRDRQRLKMPSRNVDADLRPCRR